MRSRSTKRPVVQDFRTLQEVAAVKQNRVTRDDVIRILVVNLEPLSYVHAMYEGGAIAFNRIDQWSDIDLYLVVDDNMVEKVFGEVEKALNQLSPIKQKFEVKQLPWPGVAQAFYRLEDTSEYLLIDLAVIKLSGTEKFLEPEIHGKAVFHFNKADVVKVPKLNRDLLNKTLNERLERLKERFNIFNVFVQKEINRGNCIEAFGLYHSLTLGSVVDALRIKYSPFHHDFKTRYLRYELPKEIVDKLDRLYFVKDGRDLQEKYLEASQWFRELVTQS